MRRPFNVLLICFLFIGQCLTAMTIEECNKKIITAIDALNKKEHVRSLEILNEVQKAAQENKWYKEEFLAINNIGNNYYMMLDYGEALDRYLDAYKIALAHLDGSSEMSILNNIAILYSKNKKYNKAEEYFNKALDIAKTKNDSVKITIYASNLAIVNNDKENTDKALQYLKIATKFNTRKKFTPIIKHIYIDYLYLKHNYAEAEEKTLQLLPELNDKESEDNRIGLLVKLAKIYHDRNNMSKSLEYLNLADKINKNIETKEEIYTQYFELYFKNNQQHKALLYKDSILLTHDSLNQIKNVKLFENSRIKFELENSQKQLSDSKDSLKKERIIFLSFLGLSIFIIIIFIWALRNSKLRHQQQKTLEERTKKINNLEREKEKNEKLFLEQELKEKEIRRLFEEEKLKNEIESKNRKLATKALYLSTRNSMIEELVTALSKQVNNPSDQDLKSYIHQLQQHLRQDNEYDNFFSHFEEINQHFLINLKNKHPQLNANDIRFLSYVYMNLSNKEISSLLNITLEACRKRKERIARKIGLSESSDLYHYITGS